MRVKDKKRTINLSSPEYYLSRELSELAFHQRVLFEVEDERNPLLERVKFLSIFSSNMDEFFMKRVGGLKRQLAANVIELTPDGRSPREQWQAVLKTSHQVFGRQMDCYKSQIRPALEQEGISIHHHKNLGQKDRKYLRKYFEQSVLPILTPLAVDPGHPFPFISNLSLSLAVMTRREGQPEPAFARVKIPQNRPRLVRIKDSQVYVPLEQIVAANLDLLFHGVEIISRHAFRVTRNADVKRNEEEANDLLQMIQEEVRQRRFATVVRLEVDDRMPEGVRSLLKEGLSITDKEIFEIDGFIDFRPLLILANLERPNLKFGRWRPRAHPRLRKHPLDGESVDIFREIARKDILVHHPYHSFSETVQQFVYQAAHDPKVLAIKMVIYRTARESQILQSLLQAVENEKQVAVMVELRARFDEELNMEWVKILEEAGVHVAYGIVGLKTHAKVTLVVREEPEGLRRYVHIATGNYHSETAKIYTDLGLLTANEDCGREVGSLFNVLTGHADHANYRTLMVAPEKMRQRFLELIRSETQNAIKGKAARIIVKVNSLEDPELVKELYRASMAGVKVDLIVRGICRIRPGLEPVSTNIRVVSVVGRFLEHSRIFYFEQAGNPRIFIGSADWMHRNLDYRIEAVVPITDQQLRQEIKLILEIMLADNRKAWEMQSDGTYRQRRPGEGEKELNTHEVLMRLTEEHLGQGINLEEFRERYLQVEVSAPGPKVVDRKITNRT